MRLSPAIFGPCLLCPNGSMDQDGTWHGGGPRSRPRCTRWGLAPLTAKAAELPQFSARVCCGQTTGWIKIALGIGGPRSRPHCASWEPSTPSQKGAELPQFSAHFCCGKTAGCIKMPFGMEVGFGPGDIVLDWDAASHQKPIALNFRPIFVVAKWLHGLRYATWYGGRPHPTRLCVRWGPRSSFPKKGGVPQFSVHVYYGQTAGWIN